MSWARFASRLPSLAVCLHRTLILVMFAAVVVVELVVTVAAAAVVAGLFFYLSNEGLLFYLYRYH